MVEERTSTSIERIIKISERTGSTIKRSVDPINSTSVSIQRRTIPIGNYFDSSYFFGNHEGGYTNYTQTQKWFSGIADDILTYYNPANFNNKKALDIGCAFGYLVDELNSRGLETWGMDYSSYAIGQAETLFPSLSSYFSIENLITGTSFSNNEFDLIVAMGVPECLTDTEKDIVLTEVTRILKNAGKFYILTDSTNDFYNWSTIQYWLDKGFGTSEDVGHLPLLYELRVTK